MSTASSLGSCRIAVALSRHVSAPPNTTSANIDKSGCAVDKTAIFATGATRRSSRSRSTQLFWGIVELS